MTHACSCPLADAVCIECSRTVWDHGEPSGYWFDVGVVSCRWACIQVPIL